MLWIALFIFVFTKYTHPRECLIKSSPYVCVNGNSLQSLFSPCLQTSAYSVKNHCSSQAQAIGPRWWKNKSEHITIAFLVRRYTRPGSYLEPPSEAVNAPS